jgi:uncharacterized membrane protein
MKLRHLAAAGAVIVGLVLGMTAPALAIRTGGSMGGGGFHSSGSSYHSSGSSYHSSGSSYHSSGYHSYGSHGGSGDMDPGALIGVLVFFGILALVVMSAKGGRSTPSFNILSTYDSSPAPSGDSADVTVLRVAVDARARPFVQRELARIAGATDTATADGRAAMLREVALMLRRLRDSWLYGGARNEPMMSMGAAEQVFQRHVDQARACFQDELVRNQDGKVSRAAAPELHSTSDDGPGVMLISVVVAARHELFTVNRIGDGEELRQALESLSTMVAGELVAVEVVWMPADEDERISTIALEHAYPAPQLIAIAGARVGKVFCSFCGAPYPAEAVTCPNCGGRAQAA